MLTFHLKRIVIFYAELCLNRINTFIQNDAIRAPCLRIVLFASHALLISPIITCAALNEMLDMFLTYLCGTFSDLLCRSQSSR